MRWDQFVAWFCQQNPGPAWNSICNHPTPTTTTTTSPIAAAVKDEEDIHTTVTITTTDTTVQTSSVPHRTTPWCRFTNGTTLPLGYTFMHTECSLCQCIQSRAIRCTNLQCMPTFCVDGSTAKPKGGQCCPQCAYEKTSTACVVNGISFPHGTVLRRTNDNVQCWCQLGSIECRKASNSLFSGLDVWGNGSAVYVIVIIICVMLLFGTLICCGGTFFFYHYYQRQQQAAQQSYAEYYNNAGWQPMAEDGQVVEGSAEEKQAEAEAEQTGYPTGYSAEFVPPPYALYNGSYENKQGVRDSK